MYAQTWFILGLFILICEIFSGTFYLLIIGSTLLITGGISYQFSTSTEVELILASLLCVTGIILVNVYRKHNQTYQSFINQTDDFDIGATVTLLSVNKPLQVMYRGVIWQAQFKNQQVFYHDNQKFKIASKSGNVLILEDFE